MAITLLLIVSISGALYLSFSIILIVGTFCNRDRNGRKMEQLPKVSVVVAARNEEDSIGSCLESLLFQTYPSEQYEIIVIDDRSSDRTFQIVSEYVRRNPNVRVLSITEESNSLSGKQNALLVGLKAALGEIILLTDADCRVPPTWIEAMTHSFTDRTGLVAGFTVVENKGENEIFTKLQCLDIAYLLTAADGAIGIRKPISLIGNNFGFRKQVYDAVGGYEAVGFSVTEDAALLEAIIKGTSWQAKFQSDRGSIVVSSPVNSWKGFFKQRLRWTMGVRHLTPFGYIVLSTGFVLRLSLVISCLVALFSEAFLLPMFIALSVAVASDIAVTIRAVSLIGRYRLLLVFPFLSLFQLTYSTYVGILVLSGKKNVAWKGRTYEAHPR